MQSLNSPQRHFATLPDPRCITRNKLHALEDIVMIALCATLCGQEDWVTSVCGWMTATARALLGKPRAWRKTMADWKPGEWR